MAGDWIKFEHATLDKPEVHGIARDLSIPPEQVIGCLLRIWVWADQQTLDGNAMSVTYVTLDRFTNVTGFAKSMENAGWLVEKNGLISFPNFEKHNGETAKTRANTAKRVKRFRNGEGVTNVTSKTLPEKRREENKTPTPSLRFGEFWNAYPKSRRSDKAGNEKKWIARGFDAVADRIVAHVRQQSLTDDWRKDDGKFVPMMATYLNQARWDTGDVPVQQAMPGAGAALSADPYEVVGAEWVTDLRARMGGKLFAGTAREVAMVEAEAIRLGWVKPSLL